MKKRILPVVLALVLAVVLLGGACTPATTEVIELTYSNFFPPTHLHSILAEEWIREVEEQCDDM